VWNSWVPLEAKAKPAKNVANAPKKVDNGEYLGLLYNSRCNIEWIAPTASSSKTPAKSKKPTGTQADDSEYTGLHLESHLIVKQTASTASSSKTPAKSKNSTETPADHGEHIDFPSVCISTSMDRLLQDAREVKEVF
jgi:hypothetical protein